VQSEKFSPGFTGAPTAPTASISTANTQLATTQFVATAIGPGGLLGSMAQQNASAVAITGGSISGVSPIAVTSGGTGAASATTARTNLGLDDMATQNSGAVSIGGGVVQNTAIVGGTITNLSAPLPVNSGGTGATTDTGARTNLGLGTISTQNANNVNITGGLVQGLAVPLQVVDGGTGANTSLQARVNLGLGTLATQNSDNVGITGGTLNNIASLSANTVSIAGGVIVGITDLAVADGGTGASNAAAARTNLGAASSSLNIIASGGLSGGGNLTNDVTVSIATDSNGFGTRYISSNPPTSATGVNGDIWYQI
jgi:hypothetical protein